MKQLKTVFNFELKGMLKRKSMIVTTILMGVIVLIITTIPSFFVWFGNDENGSTPGEAVDDGFVLIYDNKELEESLSPLLGKAADYSQEELSKAVSNKEVKSGFVVHDYNKYTYIYYDQTSDSNEQNMFESILAGANQQRLFVQEGIDSTKVYEILNQPIEHENVILGKDAGSGIVIAFSIIFIMYMLILLYGTSVATSVAREKDSKTMELLITSTKPKTLILGKVAAAGLMGILQVSFLILLAFVGFMVNKSNYPQFILNIKVRLL